MTRKAFLDRALANWPAKAISLFAALLVFVFYRLNRLEERFVSVPLSVIIGEEYTPSTPLPQSVRILLRGESNDLGSVREDDLAALVDFSSIEAEGPARVPVTVEKRGNALAASPLEVTVEPQEFQVTMERKRARIVPITPSFRGYLEPGFELSSFFLDPAEVEISGPASAVSRVIDLSTDAIELSGRKNDFSAEVHVTAKDPLVHISGKSVATFRATIKQSVDFRRFEAVPVTVTGLADGLSLVDPLPLCALGIQSSSVLLDEFAPAPGLVVLDLSAVRRPGVYTLPLTARLPEGFALGLLEPSSVTVRLALSGGGIR